MTFDSNVSRSPNSAPQASDGASELDQVEAIDLSPRHCAILKDIVHTFVLGGEPVSSRTLSKHGHGLSAATIRNVMADLEESGLLCQPYTSAGRIPTEHAYRLYVRTLMSRQSLSQADKHYIDERVREAGRDADQLVAVVSLLLSQLSDQAGVVLKPAVDEVVLRSADFVPIGGGRILCVLVSTGGFVDSVVIEGAEETSRRDLVRMSNYVTTSFGGRRLRVIRDQLVHTMVDDRVDVDAWLARGLALARQAVGGATEQDVVVQGTSALIGKPELSDVDRVRLMLDTFADKARLVDMLSRCLESDEGVRVVIGQDSDITSQLDFSLVAVPYGDGEDTLGSLGVIGPSRMEYVRMVPLVEYLGATLSQALASQR